MNSLDPKPPGLPHPGAPLVSSALQVPWPSLSWTCRGENSFYWIADCDRNSSEARPCWRGEFLLGSTQQGSDCLSASQSCLGLLWTVTGPQSDTYWGVFSAVWWIRQFWHILKARSCLSGSLCCSWVKEQTKCISQFHTWMYQRFSMIQPVKYRRNLKNNPKTHPQKKKNPQITGRAFSLAGF